MTDTVLAWLRGHPLLSDLQPERLDARPGSAGLFCKGCSVLSRNENILGNTDLRRRLRFLLAVHCTDEPMPRSLLELGQWAERTAPALGENQTVRLENGQLRRADDQGIARYEAELTFEFTETMR